MCKAARVAREYKQQEELALKAPSLLAPAGGLLRRFAQLTSFNDCCAVTKNTH
jgi:hypothetical protein